MVVLDKYMNTAKAGTGKTASASVPSGETNRGANPSQGSGVLNSYLWGKTLNLYSRAQQRGSLYSQEAGNAGGASPSPTYTPGGGAQGTQQNLYSQAAQRVMPTADTWEDTNALIRGGLTPRMTYSQYLERNMNTAASGGEVTPQMQAELRRAEQAEREYKERLRQERAEINASGPLSEYANPENWSGDAALYLQAGGDIDRATVRGLDNMERRFLGEAAGSVRNTINEAGYLYQAERELMKDPTKGPNIQEQLLYEFSVDPHAMDAYNEWKASLKPGEYEALEMMGQLPSPGTLYVQKRLKEMGEKFKATYEEPELKRITNFGQNFQDETEKLYGDMVGGWQTAGELAGTIGQQTPAMAARMIPMIGPALSSAIFFASAAGGSTEEAYAKGASLQGAVDYGVLSGVVEAATEKMFDGLGGLLGKGSADELVEAFVGRFAGSDIGRSTLRWLAGSVGEGVEEVVSDLLNPLISTVYNGKTVKDSYKDLTFGEVLHDYMLGMLSGGLLGSLSFVNGQSRNANEKLRKKAVAEAIDKWKKTNTFSAFLDAVGAVQSQTEADNLARGLENKNAPQANLGAENAEGVLNNGEQTGEEGPYAASENRDAGVRTGEQGQLPGQREGAQPGGQGEVRQGVSESRGENLRSVTLRELGVTDAAEGATIQVQDENSLTGDAASAAQQVRQIGLEPVAFRGDMIVNGASVNGYIENGKVFFRTDAKYRDGTPIPPDAIVRHESVHNAKDADPGIIDTGMEIVRQRRSETEVQAMKDAYRETYKDLYDFEKMSEEEITNMLVEEIVADAYAGLNYFRDGGETVEQVRAAIGSQVESAQSIQGETESTGPPEGRAQAFIGYDEETGKGIYESNFPENTPAAEKSKRVVELVQKVWSKKPIDLVIQNEDGTTQVIQAQFDPDFDETGNRKTDLGKLAYGNRQGNRREKRVTLNLADDYYQILQDAKYITSEGERGKEGPTHKDVEVWHYFVNQIFYRAQGEEETTPYSIYIDVKQKPTGDFVYTFYAREDTGGKNNEQTTPQTNSAAVNSSENGTANGLLTDSIPDANGKSNTQNEGRASAEVTTGANSKENQRPAYTVHDGVGKLFADQLDRLTEMTDRQGTYYDGVQETLTDALLEAESEDDLDRILAGKDSDKFAYTPELTEKLWELRQLIDVEGKETEATPVQRGDESDTSSAGQSPAPSPQGEGTDRRSLEKELQELQDAYQAASDRNDTEFDYRGTLRKITELEKRLGEKDTSSASDEEGDTSSIGQEADTFPSRGRLSGEGSELKSAHDDLMEVGEATVRNDTGTYILKVRKKGDQYQAQIYKNGKLDKAKAFDTPQDAADYAVDWVKGRTEGQTDAELDAERSEQREKPGPHWPTGKEYGEEIVRQKQNKAADAATQTLRERIRRANEELKALRRLEKNTGLTDRQKARMNDIQETLDIMNDELTARKGRRAEKKNRTRQTPVTENKPTRSAAEAKNALMDLFHTAAGNRADVGRQIETKLAEIARSGKITEESRQQLYNLLMDNGMVPKQAEETFREIRNWLRGQRIYVNEQERADLGENFEDLRRRAWGAGIYLTNDLRDGRIDSVNGQLAETFGENMFPTDAALSDTLENMIDQADKGRTTQQTMQEAIEGEARETGQSANEIYADMFNRMDETLRTFAEKAGLEVDLKNRTATQLAEERQRWEDRMERKAQARRESEIRGKVLRGLQRLSRMRGKAGPEIRTQIDEVLSDIDTQARQITPAGLENLQDLQRAYEDARKAAGYVDDENMGNWIPNPYVEEKLAALTKKHVNDMSLEEVVDLGRTVAAMETAIRNQNQMIGEEFDATIEESANGVRSEVESAKGAKPGFLHKWLKEEHLSPRRFLDMLGGWTDGTMAKLSKSLEDGQTRMLDFQRRAVQSFDSFLSKTENRKWLETASGKKAQWTKYTVLDGISEDGGSYTEIELTPMMKISLYLHSRNMDNLRHIQTGGIVIPNKELYQKGKMAEAYAQGKRVKMNPETVRKIAGELTDTERTFANHMMTVFDKISKDAINEVSLQLDGFERAGVENYMPIETDRSFLKSDVAGEARASTVEGIGSIANERVHASNPVMLSDASDVLMRQIDKVSRYYGYAIPIRNFQAVNNYVFHEEGAPFSTSVKEIMNKKWGAGAEQYITKMLEDLQSSGRRGDMMSSALAKLRGNLAGATLMFNPSVALSQTASYPGAAQAVGWDGLAAGLVAGKVDPKLIEKYTPLYWYRNQGNSTQELGDYMSDKGLAQKLPWILNWIQKMDSATIRRLWAASEYRVSKDNPGLTPGSQADIEAGKDAYYQKVAEVFNRAVYDTQPNYTNMERAQILRSNSDVTKFLTMYKTVPLQYYGMMVEATGKLQDAVKSGDQGKIEEARKYAANTFGGLLAANTVYVAMKALFKGIRRKDKDYRDEEGKLTAGSVTAQLGKDLAETYAGSIIGGAEAFSAAKSLLTGSKFYGPEMSALSYVEEMVGAVNSVFKSIGDEDPRKAAGAIKDAAVTLAQGFGVPAKNMETYLMAAVRWTFPNVAMEYDNLFGGIERADMKGMDEQAVSTATNLILQNRTGLKIDKSVTDELARLYAAGENAAVPTETPSSFTYNGKTVQIADRGAYSDTWGAIVGDNLEELVTADDYVSADNRQRAALVNKLYQYATVEARREADPEYSAEGNSTYGWTVKADESLEAGVGLVDAICALDAFGHMTADKDEFGNSISGSKKAKVCAYIDAMDITDEQKDVMYFLAGYKENSLEYTPWHGYEEAGSGSGKGSGAGKRSGSGKRSGGRRSGGRKGKAAKEKAVKGSGKIQLPKAAKAGGTGGSGTGGMGGKADASLSLIQIIDKYYGGNALAAAMDGGARARGRTKVDFEV